MVTLDETAMARNKDALSQHVQQDNYQAAKRLWPK